VRSDANPNAVIRAVAKAIEAKFDQGDWLELGLITDTRDAVYGHRRLLRSLDWGDPDYHSNVIDMVPVVLGERRSQRGRSGKGLTAAERFANLSEVEEFVGLQAWLAVNEPKLHDELYAGEDSAALDALQTAAQDLGIADVREHAVRIRRSLHDDPAQAIGSSKELLETVLKAILGLHGTGPETRLDIPQLVKRANVELGLDAGGVRGDEPAAKHQRKLLGSLATLVNSAGELRNAGFGTGHGVSQRPELDIATARLAISAAVSVATFYLEAHAAQ
jgi:hypothetical protein